MILCPAANPCPDDIFGKDNLSALGKLVGSACGGDAAAAGSAVRNDDGFEFLTNGDGVSGRCSAENKSGLTDCGLLLIPILQ
jgi:hypothetical protein